MRNKWKETLIDYVMVAGIYKKEHEGDPGKVIHDLICWHNMIASNPCVSKPARDLWNKALDAVLDCQPLGVALDNYHVWRNNIEALRQ